MKNRYKVQGASKTWLPLHGYPMPETDPLREEVLHLWRIAQ